ncbi:26S proteasome regulatory subunit, putative [Eimeria acervulina]|uniref:26S proteasome regulatory subunit, putative n=1 Tax=Eimeria acervulina TaxID=5801 RepID=U6GES2_EIMAC|nr:26S proteasome regulatory subunit, putative [Eimeria acervulina]CDI78012.1 26S proteasome regulatory subunit, putative [Eimeria acervulina]
MSGSDTLDCLSSYSAVAGLLTKKVVVVHPIVLLSVVDHYNRVAKGTNRRVVGCVLGEVIGEEWHATNSFALPFEEDSKDPNVWFLDADYLQQLFCMFKKVNTLERILGWYSTGRDVKIQDLQIHEIFRSHCPNPFFLLVDVDPKDMVVPAKAYCAIEEPTASKAFRKSFVYVACTIGAYEAEEVGVEHLLRDTKNASTSTLATKVGDQLETLKMLARRLRLIAEYLSDVAEGNIKGNASIIYHVQEIFNLLPDTARPELLKAFATQTNDSMMTLYLASVVRSVLALHNLIDNKIQNKRDAEMKEKEATKAEEEKQKKAIETETRA